MQPLMQGAEKAANENDLATLQAVIGEHEKLRTQYVDDRPAQAAISDALSTLYRLLAEQTGQIGPLHQAVREGETALAYYRAEQDVARQAIVLGDMGNARMRLAERGNDEAAAVQAVADFAASLRLQKMAGQPRRTTPHYENEYGNVLVVLGEISADAQPVWQAIAHYKAAIKKRDARHLQGNDAYHVAVLYLGLGNAYSALAETFSMRAQYAHGQQAYMRAEAILEHLDDKHGVVQSTLFAVRNNLAYNLYLMGLEQRDAPMLNAALDKTRQLLLESADSRSAALFNTRHTQGCALVALGDITGDTAKRQQGLHGLELLKADFRPGDDPARYASIRECEKRGGALSFPTRRRAADRAAHK